jgi:hypothetical protein
MIVAAKSDFRRNCFGCGLSFCDRACRIAAVVGAVCCLDALTPLPPNHCARVSRPSTARTMCRPRRSSRRWALIGAVVGDGDSIAVFVDRTSQKMIRLRPGEAHAGWVLNSVLRREVTLREADRSENIELKPADMPVQGAVPVLPAAAPKNVGTLDTSYAPFIPRSAPKNGESDGI